MKFYDNNYKLHDTYIGALKDNIINKFNNFIRKKFPGYKETEGVLNYSGDSFEYSAPYNEPIFDYEISEDQSPVYNDTFVPGVSPKVECNSKHTIKIDYKNHELSLEDEDGNVINTTKIDSRLENCPTKDLINMVYDIIDQK